MSPFAGLIAGVISALMLRDARRALLAMGVPFVLVTIAQTWGIGSGRGVSPPDTVSDPSYYVVQVIIFALAAGLTVQLASYLARGRAARGEVTGDITAKRMWSAIGVGSLSTAVVLVVLFGSSIRAMADPGSVTQHKSTGGPPVAGVACILTLLVGCAVLFVLRLRQRRALGVAGNPEPSTSRARVS
jgi:hypothetical protein